MKVLVVIDVQEGFTTSEKVIDPCRKMVGEFISNGNHVIIIEFLAFGETFEDVSKEVVDYPKGFFLKKDIQNGAPQIKNLCDNLKISKKIEEFHLCGAYRNECVLSTAVGLGNTFLEAKVIAHSKAINESEDSPMWDRLEPQITMHREKSLWLGGPTRLASCEDHAMMAPSKNFEIFRVRA